MKAFKVITVLLSILVCGILAALVLFKPGSPLSKTEAAHAVSIVFNMNKFVLGTDENINRMKIEIFWNDEQIFQGGKFIGKAIADQRSIYGRNTFLIKYNSVSIGKFVQRKFNNWHYYKYTFTFVYEGNNLVASLKIEGPDETAVPHPMTSVP